MQLIKINDEVHKQKLLSQKVAHNQAAIKSTPVWRIVSIYTRKKMIVRTLWISGKNYHNLLIRLELLSLLLHLKLPLAGIKISIRMKIRKHALNIITISNRSQTNQTVYMIDGFVSHRGNCILISKRILYLLASENKGV